MKTRDFLFDDNSAVDISKCEHSVSNVELNRTLKVKTPWFT